MAEILPAVEVAAILHQRCNINPDHVLALAHSHEALRQRVETLEKELEHQHMPVGFIIARHIDEWRAERRRRKQAALDALRWAETTEER